MYGMVNGAILECVSHQYVEETTQEARRKANLGTDVFISMEISFVWQGTVCRRSS